MKKCIRYMVMIAAFVMLCLGNVMTARAETAQEWKQQWYETRYYPLYPELYAEDRGFAKRTEGITYMDWLDIANPPLDMLSDMSSEELAGLMQEYPLMNQVMTYFGPEGELDYSMLYDFLESNSDIFYVLLRREDGITAILKAYQNHEPDIARLNEETSSAQSERMFLAELFGCHFIRYYAPHFTEAEHELARQIIEEKKNLYAKCDDMLLEYWKLPEIESIAVVDSSTKTNYLNEEEIQEKEDRLAAALTQTKSADPANEKKENKHIGMIAAAIGIIAVCIIGGSIWIGKRKKQNNG